MNDDDLFARNEVAIPMSRAMLVDLGHLPMNDDELAAARAAALASWERARVEWAKFEAARARLDALTVIEHPLSRRLLDNHPPVLPSNQYDDVVCGGCPTAGFDDDGPAWPCSVVDDVAAHHGIDLPTPGVSRPSETPPQLEADTYVKAREAADRVMQGIRWSAEAADRLRPPGVLWSGGGDV